MLLIDSKTFSSLSSLRNIFPSAVKSANENSHEDWPAVSWASVGGLLMENASHEKNSLKSDLSSNAWKEFRKTWDFYKNSNPVLLLLAVHLVILFLRSYPLLLCFWTACVLGGSMSNWQGVWWAVGERTKECVLMALTHMILYALSNHHQNPCCTKSLNVNTTRSEDKWC